MKTENKTETFLSETIGNYSNEELNTLFLHFDMYVYTDDNFNRWLFFDDDKHIQLNNDVFILYYFKECLKYYESKYKEYGKNELKRQINSLIKL